MAFELLVTSSSSLLNSVFRWSRDVDQLAPAAPAPHDPLRLQ